MTEQNNSYNSGETRGMSPQMPMMPPPTGRLARWGNRMMAGKAFNLTTLPEWFAAYAVGMYVVALLGVNIINSSYAIEWYFALFGIVWVAGFFFLSVKFSQEWSERRIRKPKVFEKKLWVTGLLLQISYAIFSHYFYLNMTGQPYEFETADSLEYVQTALWFSEEYDNGQFWAVMQHMSRTSFSDLGFPLFIFPIVRLFGVDTAPLFIRIVNALINVGTAVLIYRITSRAMNETASRIAAIFCLLHPVLICYVGMTLKESLMTFLVVLFVNYADKLMRNKRYSFSSIAPMVLSGIALFMFRTVMGMVVFMALFFALVMMQNRIVSIGKKIFLGTMIAGILLFSVSEDIKREIEQVTQTDVREEQETSLTKRYGTEGGKKTGNMFAKYAGTAVFAPLIFTIPFPTMVNAVEGQEDMRMIHGGNWVRNVISGFVIFAMFMLLLSGDWRKYTLPLAVLLGYLLVLVFSSFAHSLRFHIPVMPFEMMFAAYGITNMRKKHRNWYLIWCVFMVVACFAWNWFKLAGRGLA